VSDALKGLRPGTPEFDTALEQVATNARRQCRPMENIPGDADWRREMVKVYTRRAFQEAAQPR
jgi:CO/xanthine dehydrogenase FAD-binding subunit